MGDYIQHCPPQYLVQENENRIDEILDHHSDEPPSSPPYDLSLSSPTPSQESNRPIENANPSNNQDDTRRHRIPDYFQVNTLPVAPVHEVGQESAEARATLVEDSVSRDEQDTTPSQPRSRRYRQQQLFPVTKENESWGSAFEQKYSHTTRIYYQNVNSLQARNNLKWESTLEVLKELQCDISGFSETCTNWKCSGIIPRFRRSSRKLFPHSCLTTNKVCHQHKVKTTYLPGGCMQMSTSHWTGRIEEHLHDPRRLGRWCGQKYRLGNDKHLIIITAYRVCKKNTNDERSNSMSAYKQQYTSLRRVGQTCPDPRFQFIQDFKVYINNLKNPSTEIVVLIDANETIGEEKQGILSFMESTGLVDVMTRHHQGPCRLATHAKSRDRRIDFAFATPGVLPFIKACGYLPFYAGADTDHRGLFIDICNSMIDREVYLTCIPERLISTKSKKSEIRAYKEFLVQKFQDHRVFDKAAELFDMADPSKENDIDFQTKLQNLDMLVTRVMLAGEKEKCARRPATMWSLPIHHSALMIKYWRLVIKGIRNHIAVTDQLHAISIKLPESYGLTIVSKMSNPYKALRQEQSYKRTLMLQHKEIRAAQHKANMKAEAEFTGINEAKTTKRIANLEESRQTYGTLRGVYNPEERTGISTLDIPKEVAPNGDVLSWQRITDPEDVEKRILDRNVGHFGQSQGTTYTIEPMVSALGYNGTIPLSAEALQDVPVVTTDPGTIAIMDKLTDGNHLPLLKDEISYAEFCKGLRKWKEATSTSPSGRHLGHYKALLTADGADKDYSEEDPNPSQAILLVYYQIVMAAIKAGTTLNRWCHSTTAMIEKIPGSPRITKLRVIHLYEADYNLFLKIVWARKLVWHAHDANALNNSQTGSRPGRRSIDTVINKEMKYLYSRLTRTPMATMDNDATSCYDRIIVNLAMLISKYYGMPNQTCKVQAATLQKMQYRLRTALGDSKRVYQHSTDTPVHGTGQGSCASPCLWLIISSILMDCLEKGASGMTMTDITRLQTIRQWIEGFVDDTSLFTNLEDPHADILTLGVQLQKDTQLWAELLQASGGKLELSKCFYYLLAWKFNKEGDPTPMTMAEIPHTPIQVYDKDAQKLVKIDQMEVIDAHRTLGVYKTVVGQEKCHYDYLQEKSDKYATTTAVARLTRRQARVAYSTIYMPAMLYSLTAMTYSNADLTKLQSKAVEKFLPAMGFERGFPRAVVYGSSIYGGLNVGQLYTESSIAKVLSLLSHIRADTDLGKTMTINLNWLQLTSGISAPLLETVTDVSYVPDNWFLSIRQFLISIHGKISIPSLWRPIVERKQDCILMDLFIQKSGLDRRHLRLVNNWRLFYQVVYLSDIVTPKGDTVEEFYRIRPTTQSNNPYRKTNLQWPIQQLPGSIGHTSWMNCLRQCFGMNKTGQINRTLGDWTVPPSASMSTYRHNIDSMTKQLFLYNDSYTEIRQYEPERINTKTLQYIRECPGVLVDKLPETSIPCKITLRGRYMSTRIEGSVPIVPIPPIANQESFDEYTSHLPEWRTNLLHNWSTGDLAIVKDGIVSASRILMVSDGGLNRHSGSYGVIIGDRHRELISNQGIAHGYYETNSSFRSEAYGMLCACVTLYEIVKYISVPVPPDKMLSIFTDNQGLVQRLQHEFTGCPPISLMRASDIDLELQIRVELQKLRDVGFTPSIAHIKGHQDDTIPYQLLSRPAQLNVIADELATEAYIPLPSTKYFEFPANRANLVINGAPITSKITEQLRLSSRRTDIIPYMVTKFKWAPHIPDLIWWKIHGLALKKCSPENRTRIQKFNFDRLPTNHREGKYYDHIKDVCSECHSHNETDDHIIKCIASKRSEIRCKCIRAVQTYLSGKFTPSQVRIVIIEGVKAWITNQPLPDIRAMVPKASQTLIQAYEQQTQIGWRHFMRGRIATAWGAMINHHLIEQEIPEKTMTHERWGSKLVSILWEHILELWAHRNSVEHGSNPEELQQTKRRKLVDQIQFLNQSNLAVSSDDRDWVTITTTTIETMTTNRLIEWLRNAKSLIRINQQQTRHSIQPNLADDDHG